MYQSCIGQMNSSETGKMNYVDTDKWVEEIKQKTISDIVKLITTGESEMKNLKRKISELEKENQMLKQQLDDRYNILIQENFQLQQMVQENGM